MTDLAIRNPANPLLKPSQVSPSTSGLQVECLLNPGVFRYDGSLYLLVRVAERPLQKAGRIAFPFMKDGKVEVIDIAENDPDFDGSDPREFKYKGEGYLSTLSHLRLFRSDDGVSFVDTGTILYGEGPQESFGIEDPRVATLKDGRYVITYTAVAPSGYGVGLRTTRDWKRFEHHGMIISPANKDCAIFDEMIDGKYHCLHRPSGVIVGGHDIWHAESPDMIHWGRHSCIARTRKNHWDEQRIGAGAAPIRTEHGWLVIYHGADNEKRYCLGAMMLDLNDPKKVIARGRDPIMEPTAPYEQSGFFSQVVFTNGHDIDGNTINLYYGASDTVICHASLSISRVLAAL